MKRAPEPGEPYLIHLMRNTGAQREFALIAENFNPAILNKLVRNLPDLPGLRDWSVAVAPCDETGHVFVEEIRFLVIVRGACVSKNHAKNSGESGENIMLMTVLEYGAELLTPDEAEILADLEQCVAVALLRRAVLINTSVTH